MKREIVAIVVMAIAVAQQRASAQHFTQTGDHAPLTAPIVLDSTGLFQSRFVRVGDDMFIAGQPTEAGLRKARSLGVTTVVNLRTPEEMKTAVPFDEPALVTELGMRYVYLPVRGTAEFPYAPTTVVKFAEALSRADGKVLLHCTVAWRASHLWAAYLIQDRAIPVEEALAHARVIDLMPANHNNDARLPIEDFLNRSIPCLHGKC